MFGRLKKLVIPILLIMCSFNCAALAGNGGTDGDKKADDSGNLQEAINRDRELLKKLMSQGQNRSPDPEVMDLEFSIGDNPVEGSSDAKFIIVQFSDYSCHHCALFTEKTYPEIVKNYVETGKLRYVVIDYPLPDNLFAVRASEAAHCASDQGKFREMHEEIMLEQDSLDDIDSMASFINLDMEKFNGCMESKKYEAVVSDNILLGTNLKIPSVPNFIIAGIDPVDPKKVKGITYIRGAKPYEYFQQEIDKVLLLPGSNKPE